METDLPTKYVFCSYLIYSNKLQIVSYAIGESLCEIISNYNASSEREKILKHVLASWWIVRRCSWSPGVQAAQVSLTFVLQISDEIVFISLTST